MQVNMRPTQPPALANFIPDLPGRQPRSLSPSSLYRSAGEENRPTAQHNQQDADHSQISEKMPGGFPDDDSGPQTEPANSTRPHSRAASVTHVTHAASLSLQDVSSLLAPFEYDAHDGHSSKSKGKGKAVATSDDDDGDMDYGAHFTSATDDDAGSDDEDLAGPVPRIVISEGDNSNTDENGERTSMEQDDAQRWTAYQPPPALTEVLPENLPEVLVKLVQTSVENLQAQAARAVAARTERLEKAAAEQEAAREKAAQEKSKLEPWQTDKGIMWPQAKEIEEPTQPATPPKLPSLMTIEPDTDTYLLSRMTSDPADAEPPSPTQKIKQPKRSRRHLFAARLLRHVHVSGSERGESSAAGALSGAKRPGEKIDGDKRWLKGRDGHYRPAPPISTLTEPGEPEDSIAIGIVTEVADYEPGMAPISEEARTVMMQTAKEDGNKNKEPVAPETIECISCFDDIPVREAVKTVCHSYCLECFRQLITTALENEAQFPPKCCLNEVPVKTIMLYVPRELGKRYKAKADEFNVPVDDRLYCPTPDCGLFVPLEHISKAASVGRCRNGHETCTICRQAAHGTGRNRQPCPEDHDQRLADDLATESGWRRCIRCGVTIEHRDACQHMTCRCGAEFCFVCRAPWRTCHCSMEDLHQLKDDAAARRRVREAREAQEAAARARAEEEADRELEELREALRQVEEFERQETLRLEERRRQHRERLAQLRTRREAVLRHEIAARYQQHRATLADVMTLQCEAAHRIRVDERTGRGERDAAELVELEASQAADRVAATAAAEQRVQLAEQDWEQDYQVRVRLEKQLEAAYRATLLDETADLWTGRKDRAARVAAALSAYMRRNDERLDAYLRWRDRELDAVRYLAEEDRCMALELLDRQHLRCVEGHRANAAEMRKRHRAERVWCRAVAAERERLIAELEAMEQAMGLEGSTAEADVELLMLIEMEQTDDGLDGADMDYSLMLLASMAEEEAAADAHDKDVAIAEEAASSPAAASSAATESSSGTVKRSLQNVRSMLNC